jgi:hypothetical protein
MVGVCLVCLACAIAASPVERLSSGKVRKEDLRKVPGVAETLDWAATLAGLDVHDLRQEPEAVFETMMCLLKTQEDRARLTREVSDVASAKGPHLPRDPPVPGADFRFRRYSGPHHDEP